MKNQVRGELCLSLFCIIHIAFSQNDRVHNILLGVNIICSVADGLVSRINSTTRTFCKMKTRTKCAPTNPSLAKTLRKRKKSSRSIVSGIELTIALKELIENSDRSIRCISDGDSKLLANRFKVSQNIVKSKIAEMQPIVSIRKM